jgi:hypothetical protein
VLFLFSTELADAQESSIVVSPQIIDEKVKARDILERKVVIENKTAAKASIYAVVFDFSDKEGSIKYEGPGSADKKASIASWITLKRGENELMPGEKIELPLNIKVNLNAQPGKYYAVVYYVTASNGYEAEASGQSGAWPKTIINLEVVEHKVEKVQITKFIASRNFYLDGPASLFLHLQNNGNSDIIPSGNVRIYDRRGDEVADLEINRDKKNIAPAKIDQYNIIWPAGGQMGKFKAMADVKYGADNDKTSQDIIFFWVIPKKILIMLAAGIVVMLVLLGLIISRRNKMYAESKKEAITDDRIINLKH